MQCFPVDSRPEVDLIDSPIDSQPWFEAIAFLKQHLQPSQTLFAPNTLRLVFPEQIPYEGFDTIDLTINYVSKTLKLDSSTSASSNGTYDWVVFHKGVNDDYVGGLLFQAFRLGFKPVFANSVFTIFTSDSNAKARSLDILGYGNQDVRSVFTRYVKHQLGQLTDKKSYQHFLKDILRDLKSYLNSRK